MTSSDFSISGVNTSVGTQLDAENKTLGDMVDHFDANAPAAAFKVEMEVAKYKAEVGLMSALVKDISDIQQQIIQKV